MNDTDNNQQRQTTPPIAKCHELADMVNILFDQSGLQDLLIGKYQPVKLVDIEQLQQHGQFSRLKTYCALYGLDFQEVGVIGSKQNLQHWNTTSGTFYRVEELDTIRERIRRTHSQYLKKYIELLHSIDSNKQIISSWEKATVVDSSTVLDAINHKISVTKPDVLTDTYNVTADYNRLHNPTGSEAPEYSEIHELFKDKTPYTTILCDTNVLLDEVTMRWLAAMYQAGAHFELYISKAIINELQYVINEPHEHRLAVDVNYKNQYKNDKERIQYIVEHMTSFAALAKKDKEEAKRSFLGSDPVDLHLHHAMITNEIDILATNDLQLFSHLSQEQRQSMPYRVCTADECLATVARDNMKAMQQTLAYLHDQIAEQNSVESAENKEKVTKTVRLPLFHAEFAKALGLSLNSAATRIKMSNQSEQSKQNSNDTRSNNTAHNISNNQSIQSNHVPSVDEQNGEYICPICADIHTRVFSSDQAKEHFIRHAQALFEKYPQLCNPEAQPYLVIYYESSVSVIRNTHGRYVQYHAKLGSTGVSINTCDKDKLAETLAQTLYDICPNCQLREDQFVEQLDDVEFEYAAQWQHNPEPDMSITDFFMTERSRIATFLTAYGVSVTEDDSRFAYVPDYVCENYNTVIYIDSCLWHTKDYPGKCKFEFHDLPLLQWQEDHERERREELAFRQQLQELGWNVIQLPHCVAVEKHRRGAYASLFEAVSGEPFTEDVLLRPSQRIFELEQRVRELESDTENLWKQLSTMTRQETVNKRTYVTKR